MPTAITDHLTQTRVMALAAVINTVGTKVVRIKDDKEFFGTSRYLCGDQDSARPDDVREAYLRVTTRSGFEAWWPVNELADDYLMGLFRTYDWS